MGIETNTYIDAIAKLIELTQENKLRWETSDLKKLAIKFPKDRIECAFQANHDNKILQLRKSQALAPIIDYSNTDILSMFESKMRWATVTTLAIIDNDFNVIWEFPSMDITDALLTSVRYQVSGINDFIKNLTKKELDINVIFQGEWTLNYNKGKRFGTEKVSIKLGLNNRKEYYRNNKLAFIMNNIIIENNNTTLKWTKTETSTMTDYSTETLKIISENKIIGIDSKEFKLSYLKLD